MNKTEKILKWIREVDVKSLPYNVVGVGWGPKEKNGQETGEYCVVFTVKTKKPIEEIDPKEIIPKDLEILINDENSNISELISFKTDIKEPNFCEKLVSYCNQGSNTLDPVKQHRLRRRKLMGGIETMTIWGSYVATLGIFVKDKTDGQIVALSNNHVFANSQVSSKLLTPNEQDMTTTLEISAYQPTVYWRTTQENDYIGKCKRAVMIGDINPNIVGIINNSPIIADTSCDAAILQLSSYDLINSTESPNILNFNAKAPFQFATDSEIDSLAPGGSNQGSPIFRSGRTLGAIGSPGDTYSCNLSVYQLNTAFVGTYSGYLSYFSNSFYVRGNVAAGAGGDSGSAMFALYNQGNPSLSAWKLIGLLFAGPSDSSYTIGCRITNIAKALDIAPWDTSIPSFSSTKTVAISGNTYSNSIELSGRKFYQVGYLENTPQPTASNTPTPTTTPTTTPTPTPTRATFPIDTTIYDPLGNILFTVNGNVPPSWKAGSSIIGYAIIGSSATIIANWAFQLNQLTSVTIPNSVTSIGVGAFIDNSNLSIVNCYATQAAFVGYSIFQNTASPLTIHVRATDATWTAGAGLSFQGNNNVTIIKDL